MITPFEKSQRGNSLTTARLQNNLTDRGFRIDRLSLEGADWQDRLQDALANTSYTLVHGFHALHFAQVLEAIPEIRRLPLLLTTTGTDIHYDLQGSGRNMVLCVMQAVQNIVLFNEDFRRDLEARYPELHDKLITIPQGVYLERGSLKTREELGLAPDDVVFLLPSGIRTVKNIGLAIDSLSKLHREYSNLRLLIMGAAIEKQYSRQIFDRINDLSWVTYLGEIPHAEMSGIFSLGDVVLNTSHSEGQPQGALEAMSLGKPCILTAVPGNLNLIEAGREGFYINGEAQLVAAAESLINDPVRREAMGRQAQNLIAARFTLEQELVAYTRLYNNLGSGPNLLRFVYS
jgi:glycosyltransferase involved in cell wall biosynthesis